MIAACARVAPAATIVAMNGVKTRRITAHRAARTIATWIASGGLLAAVGILAACNSGKSSLSPGAGGRASTGGVTSGDGGAAGGLGSGGGGGHPDTGGSSTDTSAQGGQTHAAGGAPAVGGASTTGGASATGGTSATGGATGAGGRSGTGGTKVADAAVDAVPRMGTPCRSQSDCGPAPTLLYCRAPGDPLGCGACQQGRSTCASDTDCIPDGGGTGAKRICDIAPSTDCYCTAIKRCVLGCRTNTDCGSGQGCNAQHTCQPTCVPGDGSCTVDDECGAGGFCQQKACTTDAECSAACVNGKCYGGPGQCQPPVA